MLDFLYTTSILVPNIIYLVNTLIFCIEEVCKVSTKNTPWFKRFNFFSFDFDIHEISVIIIQ